MLKMLDGKRKILNVIFFLATNIQSLKIIYKLELLELQENNLT